MSKPILCLNTHELAWAAGFFDGEGTVYARKRTPKRRELSLTIAQVETTTLHRFNRAVGSIGKVRGPYRTQLKGVAKKPVYIFDAYGHPRVQAIIAMLWAWLGIPKRRQAIAAIAAVLPYEKQRVKDLCKRGHPLSGTGANIRLQKLRNGYVARVCQPCVKLRRPSKEHARQYAKRWREKRRLRLGETA